MTERDWLALDSVDDLHGELAAVVQPRKLFQLGSAFLTRVQDDLASAARDAVEATLAYAGARAGVGDLLRAWSSAYLESGDEVWSGEVSDPWEDSLDEDEEGVLARVREAIRHPAWFAAHAACLAVALAGQTVAPAQRAEARVAERRAQFPLYADLVGDPLNAARPAPVPPRADLIALLRSIDRQAKPDPLALLALADALEEAGCSDSALLLHLRGEGPHFRGCWAVERAAGRERIALPVDDSRIWALDDYEPWRRWWR